MRRVIITTLLAVIFSGYLAAASAGRPVGATVAAPAPLGAGKNKTDLDVFGFDGNGEIKSMPAGSNNWDLRWPGYNIIRTLTNSQNKNFLFLLNGYTGEAQTFELKADGSIGKSPWWTGLKPNAALRCTNADIFRSRNGNVLVTQDALTGTVRTFTLNDDGSPMASYTEKTLVDMQDKNVFQVYYNPGLGYQMIGVDTWTGKAVAYGLNMQKSAGATWTKGWTSLDSLYLDEKNYRLLYKAAGDPYRKPDPEVSLKGRFIFQVVGSDGIAAQTIQDIPMIGDFSSVRFIKYPSESGATNIGVLFYKRTTGNFVLYEVNLETGIGGSIDNGTFVEPDLSTTPYTDLQPCVVEGKSYLAFVSADGAKPLSYEQANAYGQTIYDKMYDTAVGYQLILAQSGRTMYRQAWGKLKLDHVPSSEIDMTTHTQLETGSVSKMITALTVLKLAEQGKIDLSAPISNYLAPDQFNPGSWAETTPVRALLTHTSGVSSNDCKLLKNDAKVDCAPFFAKTPDLPCDPNAPGGFNCKRSYNGSNYRALRKIIEFVTNKETSSQITDETHDLWANDIGLGEITCHRNSDAFYYGVCEDPMQQNCYAFNNRYWQRIQQTDVDQNGWLPGCSSRHWYASSRELMAFLGAIRYRQILKNSAMTDYLLRTDLNDLWGDPGSTAVAWGLPASLSGGTVLGKGGYLPLPAADAAALAYIARLPYNCDVAVLLNTKTKGLSTLVNNTFQTVMP
jgi:CubicO group peptidase (beta-lactamase class C family)